MAPTCTAADVMQGLTDTLEKLKVALDGPDPGLGASGPVPWAWATRPPRQAAMLMEVEAPPAKKLKGFVAASQAGPAHETKAISLSLAQDKPGY